jgi:hypothetical protein
LRVIPLASKVDGLLKDLKNLADEVNQLKRGVFTSPLVPLPRPVKAKLALGAEVTDRAITDAYFNTVQSIADVVLPAAMAREVINNPNILMDTNGSISQIPARPAPAKPRKVTKKMRQQRKIQSTAFRNANAKARKKNGELRAGFDQRRIALMAQRECTKERQRLGLCEKPKRKKSKK